MDDVKQDKTQDESTAVMSHNTETDSSGSAAVVRDTRSPIVTYIIVAVAIILLGLGLVYLLEKEGRLQTNLFANVIAAQQAKSPVAKVNGVSVARSDYENSMKQLRQMATMQGMDTSSPETEAELKAQALDTLVNSEILRQAAASSGITTTPEAVEERLSQIREGVGGPEMLAQRMAELGITEENLRRDIENEILIQDLFESALDFASITVSEEEIKALYDQVGGTGAGLPPLAEIRSDVEAQVKSNKEQGQIAEYLEQLRAEAEIEVLI